MVSDVDTAALSQPREQDSRPPATWRRPFETWLDGVEQGWTIPGLLIGFVAVWMIFFTIAYLNADLHPDVLETWSIGRTFEWGNAKHPPLMGWVSYLWSVVFPLTDWSFQLLALTNSAAALWAVDLIARRFVRGDKRVIVLLLLMLLPAYQFHAQRFNANTVLMAIWPLATYCFLRSFETRAWGWSAIAGALAALAMLGKYYSIFLIGSFGLAAVFHPQRRLYFLSLAPWISTIAGLIVITPHLHWLATHEFAPMTYALEHAGRDPLFSFKETGRFLLGVLAYLALPTAAWLLMIRAALKKFATDIRKIESGLKLLALVFLGTVLFPIVVCMALDTDLPALWNLQGLFFVIVIAVAATTFAVDRFDTVNLAAGVLAFSLAAVVVAPFHAAYRNVHGFNEGRNFLHGASDELTRRWHELSDKPLPAISGDDSLAFATAFYSPDHPLYARPFRFQYAWGQPRQSTLDKGWAALCFAGESLCEDWMRRLQTRQTKFVRSEIVLTSRLWGTPGVSTKIIAIIAPPRGDRPSGPAPEQDGNEEFGASRRHADLPNLLAVVPDRETN